MALAVGDRLAHDDVTVLVGEGFLPWTSELRPSAGNNLFVFAFLN